jgi:hypothetical protein
MWIPFIATLTVLLLTGCTHPHHIDVKLNEILPEAKTTTFSQAVLDLGLMSEIYGDKKIRVMPQNIIDNTGTSLPTGSEVPRDITEIIKSTLNGIGGNIIFVPYDPEFMIAMVQTGHTGWENKLLPTIVVSGGITEFDRGLETRGKNTDLGLEGEIQHINLGWEWSTLEKDSLASITLDFNAIDFQTHAGIPRVQAVNTIKVRKAMAEDSLGFTIQGNTLGFKGTIKKVQGRHAAIRMLVELSMIQLIGKYLNLPYWQLLPNGKPDPLVIEKVLTQFYAMDEPHRIAKTQEYLALHGYPVTVNGSLDEPTREALRAFKAKQADATGQIDQATYLALFATVPITPATQGRRQLLAQANASPSIASLAPAAKVAATVPPAQPSSPSAPAGLHLATTARNYAIGEALGISIRVDAPMYLRLFHVSSIGEISPIFPNRYQRDEPFKPGQTYQIPGEKAPYVLRVEGPRGVDRIMAIASPHPFPSDLPLLTSKGEFTPTVLERFQARAAVPIRIH